MLSVTYNEYDVLCAVVTTPVTYFRRYFDHFAAFTQRSETTSGNQDIHMFSLV